MPSEPMPYGIVIRGGAVYEGSGGPAEFAMLRGQETQPVIRKIIWMTADDRA